MCCIFVALAGAVRAQWRPIRNTFPEPEAALARDMLAAHNEIRASVHVPPLAWSDRLAARAQEWAVHLLQEKQFYHRPHPVFGENLFEINGSHALPVDVVGVWASEARDYSYPRQHLLGRLRPLHASHLEPHARSGLRRRPRSPVRKSGSAITTRQATGSASVLIDSDSPNLYGVLWLTLLHDSLTAFLAKLAQRPHLMTIYASASRSRFST